MDQNPDPVLDDLAQRAYDFSINLDGRVERSPTLYSRGHCAVVYKGTFLPNNIEVAVKIAAGDLARRGILEVIKDAVREVHTWSKVRHKNVHPLLGITTEFDHTISFVSAWMEKGNAHDYVQDVEVDPRPLIQGIARGLHYLHDYKPASIFHGNLKGSNVLVSQDGHALLTDFGFTRVVNSSLKMTVDKICAGALNWMAPEIVKGGELSAEGDVWAFGMTALELFTRSIPFPDRGHPLVRPSEDETLSRLTDRWWEMCSSCWDGQPFLRPQMSGVMKSISLLSTEELRPDAVRDDRVLEISGIGVWNTGAADSAELITGGKHHKLSHQGEGSVLRADFNPPLELPLHDQFSLSIEYQPEPGLTRRADISLDAWDVLSKSDQRTFRRTLEHLEIILEISASASPDLLIPTTDELLQQCPHFRLLIIGKSGVGKASLIRHAFGVEEASPEHDKRGNANIEKPMVSKRNRLFILYDSEGFEPGENNNTELAKTFIKRRKTHEDVKEQLHAVWLCFQIPLQTYGQRMLETGMEDFLRDKKNILGDIPTVFVFTKYDKLADEIENRWVEEGRDYEESDVDMEAEQYLKKNCVERIERLTGESNIPWLAVSTKARYQSKLKELVRLTYQQVYEHFVQSGPSAVTMPRIRILLIGKTGVGTTSLIRCTFDIEEALPVHEKRGEVDIQNEVVSERDRRFILHDSNGLAHGESSVITVVKSFIERRKTHEDVKEQLHTIWLNFQIPLDTYGEHMIETVMEDFLHEKDNILGNIPTVFVFTKYDKLVDEIENRWEEEGRKYTNFNIKMEAEQYLQKHCIECVERLTEEHNIPCIAVSTKARHQHRLKQLVQLTHQRAFEYVVRQQGMDSSAVAIVAAMALRVDSLLMAASIAVGERRYWEALSIGDIFSGQKTRDCLQVIHTDIVKVWNLFDPSEVLLGQEFRESILDLVNLLEDNNSFPDLSKSPQFLNAEWMPGGFKPEGVMNPIKWVHQPFRRTPEMQRKFMAYIVDLTHVMDILFILTDGRNEQGITLDFIQSVIAAYRESKKQRNVYSKIRAFPGTIRGGDITSEIKSLVSTGFDNDKELEHQIGRIANTRNSNT